MAKSYQEQIEEQNPDLQNTDDNGDITEEVVGKTTPRGSHKTPVTEEDDLPEDSDTTEETEEEIPDTKETVYRKDQVQKIVQTRVNTYTKRIDKLQGYKTAVDKICEVTGLDFDKLVARLTGMTDEEQAKILGVPVEQVKQVRETRRQIAEEKGKTQTLSRQLEETQLKADPNYGDYDLYKEEIDDLLADNPKLTAKQAYLLVKGDTAVKAAARDAEQRTVANRVNAAKKQVVKPTGGAQPGGPKIDPQMVSAAKAVGMDPVEYARYQSIDNIDAYRAMKAKQKK